MIISNLEKIVILIHKTADDNGDDYDDDDNSSSFTALNTNQGAHVSKKVTIFFCGGVGNVWHI
jgi:hypothetical protein